MLQIYTAISYKPTFNCQLDIIYFLKPGKGNISANIFKTTLNCQLNITMLVPRQCKESLCCTPFSHKFSGTGWSIGVAGGAPEGHLPVPRHLRVRRLCTCQSQTHNMVHMADMLDMVFTHRVCLSLL